jgi:hypothetical protein
VEKKKSFEKTLAILVTEDGEQNGDLLLYHLKGKNVHISS